MSSIIIIIRLIIIIIRLMLLALKISIFNSIKKIIKFYKISMNKIYKFYKISMNIIYNIYQAYKFLILSIFFYIGLVIETIYEAFNILKASYTKLNKDLTKAYPNFTFIVAIVLILYISS